MLSLPINPTATAKTNNNLPYGLLLALLIVFQWVNTFTGIAGVSILVAALCLAALIVSLAASKGPHLVLSIAFITGGSIIILLAGGNVFLWFGAFGYFADILALILVVPVMTDLFQRRPYANALLSLGSRWIKSLASFHTITFIIVHLIVSVMSVSGLIITYELIKETFEKNPLFQRIFIISALRAYGASALWSPNATTFAIVLHFTGAPIGMALVWGLVMASVALAVSIIMTVWDPELRVALKENPSFFTETALKQAFAAHAENGNQERVLPGRTPATESSSGSDKKLSMEFLSILVAIIATVLLLGEFTPYSLVTWVPLVALASTIIGRLLSGGRAGLRELTYVVVRNKLPSRTKEITLVIGSGFLVFATTNTNAGNVFLTYFQSFVENLSVNMVFALPVLVIILGFIGFPPTPAAALISGSLAAPSALGLPPEVVLLAVTTGVMASFCLAPVSIPVLLLSGSTGKSILTVGLHWNWRYAVTAFIVTQLLLQGAVFWGLL